MSDDIATLTTAPTSHWRKLNQAERAAIAKFLARQGFGGFMFVETPHGELVPMVFEPVENKPDTTTHTEE